MLSRPAFVSLVNAVTDQVTYGYSPLLFKRVGLGKEPKWRCFSIRSVWFDVFGTVTAFVPLRLHHTRTTEPERSYDFVCSNDRAAMYFCHGLMVIYTGRYFCFSIAHASERSFCCSPKHLCQSNVRCPINKAYSLGSMLWTRYVGCLSDCLAVVLNALDAFFRASIFSLCLYLMTYIFRYVTCAVFFES